MIRSFPFSPQPHQLSTFPLTAIPGEFNFFTSYMSQPKFQLETFKVSFGSSLENCDEFNQQNDNDQAWAGLGSDISYYLNSHHIDLHVWAMQARNPSSSQPQHNLHPWRRQLANKTWFIYFSLVILSTEKKKTLTGLFSFAVLKIRRVG